MTNGTEEVQTGDQAQPQDATGGGEQPGAVKALTQDEVNRLMGDLRASERSKRKELQDALDELRQKAEQWDQHQEEQKTELEKAQERVAKIEAERDEARAEAVEALLVAAFTEVCAEMGVANPKDVYSLDDTGLVEIDGDGKITGVKEAVTALVDAGRVVVKTRPQAPALDGGAGGGERPGERVTLSPEELKVAIQLGLTPEQYLEGKKRGPIAARTIKTEE